MGEEKSLAYEMLEELKTNSKRWFGVAIFELVIIIIMVVGFLVYESQYQYADESYQSIEDVNESSNINQRIGE